MSTAWNPVIPGMGASPTLAINELSRKLMAEGRRVSRLGLGQSPFPVPAFVVEALRRHAGEKDYLAVRGLERLRETVAAYHARVHGVEARADRVQVGPGSKELIFLLQLVLDAELVLPAPSWVSYTPQARLLGRRVHWVKTRREAGWRLEPGALEEALGRVPEGRRLVLLNYPNNPTGQTLRADWLQELAGVLRKMNALVVSDEIYGGVDFTGRHESLAKYYPEGTILSGGLSKWCGAGGWRLGTFVLPAGAGELASALAAAASETFTAVAAPIQFAAVEAFRESAEMERYLVKSRRILRGLGLRCAQILRAGGWDLPDPEGGFYVLAEAPLRVWERFAGRTGQAMTETLLAETGTATLAGSHFGMPAEWMGFRAAFVDFDGAAALDGLAEAGIESDPLPEGFLETYGGATLAGFKAAAEW